MSWERTDYDEQSPCACGKGKIIKHSYYEDDDWGRNRSGFTGIEIQCSDCKAKYHYDSITRHYSCPSWEGNGFYTKEYLVPKELKIPTVITAKTIFGSGFEEDIVCCLTKKDLEDAVIDMQLNKYSTRVQKDQSRKIIDICNKRIHVRSLKRIIPILQEIIANYEQYEWNPVTIAEYKQKEADEIAKNESNIADVISKSYELHFSR